MSRSTTKSATLPVYLAALLVAMVVVRAAPTSLDENPESSNLDRAASRMSESEDPTGDVMALSDDVIIDALFTNMEKVQDQLEVCEEGLRQKITGTDYDDLELTHGDIFSGSYNTEDGSRGTDSNNTQSVKDNNVNTNNSIDDDLDEIKVKGEHRSMHKTRVKVTHSEYSHKKHILRRRREAGKSSTAFNNSTGKNKKLNSIKSLGEQPSSNHGTEGADVKPAKQSKPFSPNPSYHNDVLTPTEAVVKRLSERFEYLKNSLIDCHVLYLSLH